jgi:hypothetical protein
LLLAAPQGTAAALALFQRLTPTFKSVLAKDVHFHAQFVLLQFCELASGAPAGLDSIAAHPCCALWEQTMCGQRIKGPYGLFFPVSIL